MLNASGYKRKVKRMRTIDADALKLYLQENLEKPPTSIFGVIAKMEMSDIVEAVCKDIDNQPTVDPVRRGKWIDGRCSQCGGEACWKRGREVYGWREFALELTKYCPNCGSLNEEDGD